MECPWYILGSIFFVYFTVCFRLDLQRKNQVNKRQLQLDRPPFFCSF